MRRPAAERARPARRRGGSAAGLALAAALLSGAAAADCARPAEGFAAPSAAVEAAAAEAGLLAELHVTEGARVAAGDLLARLDPRLAEADLAAAEARAAARGGLALAEARAGYAERRLAEIARLDRSGAVRPLERMEAEAELALAEAELTAARDALRLAALDAARARARLATLEVRAPAAGVVDAVHRQEGEFVGSGAMRIATLLTLDPLRLDLWAPAACLGGLTPGDAVAVTDAAGREHAARVRDVGRRVDAPTGLLRLSLDVANAGGALRAGERLSALPGATGARLGAADVPTGTLR